MILLVLLLTSIISSFVEVVFVAGVVVIVDGLLLFTLSIAVLFVVVLVEKAPEGNVLILEMVEEDGDISQDKPKSQKSTRPELSKTIFEGLMSRWRWFSSTCN